MAGCRECSSYRTELMAEECSSYRTADVQLLKSADLGRHSLLYLKEIGHDWFGKVFLGEVNAGLSTTQVVVKELNASASIQEQMQFLEEALPYRTLQHPAILQCLAQCTDVTPYLLIMEYCPLYKGDVKGYLRSCRAAGSATPDPFILQQMACEIASGLQYLHKHNYIHSDLALRNCLLTSEMSVKIGDYGLSHSRYKDDYFVTADQIWVPLRWIAPELIDEVHGNLLVVDQTKASNVWSLGVTIWELFELGSQPYRHYTDRQVLTYAVKEQQLKLPKPLLKVPLSERWYEVMQFCWLQPEQRPVVEEVYLLLNYLCAKGTGEAEEDFEKRWNSLRPSLDSGSAQRTPALEVPSSNSSFPLLEHFSMVDSFQSENGDEILTVTETSDGLNFEYKWEQARAEQPYCSSSTSGPLGSSNPHYQDIYYPLSSSTGSCKGESLNLGVSPSQYKSDHPGVVPVLSAHSPSVSSEYYIRIEEPVECNISVEEATLDYSPELEASKCTFSMAEMKSPTEAHANTYWPGAKVSNSIINDSDASPSAALRDTSKTRYEPPQRQDMNHMDSAEQLNSPSDFAKVGDINLAHIPLQREVQNQDPQEFIELASSSSPCEAFSPDAYHTSIQPKSLDSGYDTENNESPEFVMKDLEGKPVLSTSVESEYEMVLQMDLEENDLTPTSNSTLNLASLANRNQYRDSAYFSDYDAENEKSPCEEGSIFFDNKLGDFFGKEPVKDGSLKKAGRDGGFPVSQKEDQYHFPSPVITLLAPFPPEMGGCLTKESAPDDGLGVESEHSGEEPASECFSSTASEGSSTTQEASTMEDQVNSTSMGFSSAESLGSASTILEVKDCENGEDNLDCQMDGENMENKGVEEQAELVEEALLNVKRDSSLDNILPALPENLGIPAPLGNCEEEEDSDDSDESDEELRSYSVQEQSEESEEEFTTVPMVVMSERSSTRHLRSLLKMPSLLTQSFCDELERKKKAVSFFDDVTVFLFDQDSPTGELAEYTFPPGMEANGQAAECRDHPSQKEVSDSDNVVQDSGTLEWENDFPLKPNASTLEPDSDRICTPLNSPVKLPEEKPAPQCSRFSVSRFSITQVSDSDVESMGEKLVSTCGLT
ncbi:hypothetical protein QTP70_024059 [Hemibagrus guttatus]|uniref:non-specific serine/threonine protein kinase n=1 Tax=Hemibagrus guttatus TaxID=175788 RepID=A0AAE0QGN2_9TELE|nr:hypothetical protein QTP70_024059 [Hemibagrus guttatus]